MSKTLSELETFYQFAKAKLSNDGADSLEELLDLWRIEHPTPEEVADIQQAIREGIADLKAGRYRPAEDVVRDIRRKYNLPE
jgi:hypothetical protein